MAQATATAATQPRNNDGTPRACQWCSSTTAERRWGRNDDAECVNGTACVRRQVAAVDAQVAARADADVAAQPQRTR